jgi:hypothetical protein
VRAVPRIQLDHLRNSSSGTQQQLVFEGGGNTHLPSCQQMRGAPLANTFGKPTAACNLPACLPAASHWQVECQSADMHSPTVPARWGSTAPARRLAQARCSAGPSPPTQKMRERTQRRSGTICIRDHHLPALASWQATRGGEQAEAQPAGPCCPANQHALPFEQRASLAPPQRLQLTPLCTCLQHHCGPPKQLGDKVVEGPRLGQVENAPAARKG